MRFTKPKPDTIIKSVYAGVLIALSGVLFVLFLEAIYRFIRVRSGLTSWVALMSLLVLGIAELSFVIYSGELIRKRKRQIDMLVTFLRTLGVIGWLFAVLEIFEVWTYIPQIAQWWSYISASWGFGTWMIFAAGIVAGIGGPVVARIIKPEPRVKIR